VTIKPILFSGPMVRAILREIEQAGTGKTQTRRVLKDVPIDPCSHVEPFRGEGGGWIAGNNRQQMIKVPYAKCDKLYVREAWRTWSNFDHMAPRDLINRNAIAYHADCNGVPPGGFRGKYRQGMHMPRWASRSTLDVAEVRVERVQDISEEDAKAEGIEARGDGMASGWMSYEDQGNPLHERNFANPIDSFRTLWDSINAEPKPRYAMEDGKRVINHYESFPWGGESRTETHRGKPHIITANPWVAAYTFKPRLGNVDG